MSTVDRRAGNSRVGRGRSHGRHLRLHHCIFVPKYSNIDIHPRVHGLVTFLMQHLAIILSAKVLKIKIQPIIKTIHPHV